MSAIWHDSGTPSFLSPKQNFSFHELPGYVQEAPDAYQAAMADLRVREMLLGTEWYTHNAWLAHEFYMAKRSWWLIF